MYEDKSQFEYCTFCGTLLKNVVLSGLLCGRCPKRIRFLGFIYDTNHTLAYKKEYKPPKKYDGITGKKLTE